MHKQPFLLAGNGKSDDDAKKNRYPKPDSDFSSLERENINEKRCLTKEQLSQCKDYDGDHQDQYGSEDYSLITLLSVGDLAAAMEDG